jgi:single-stranded DNA-binding protein
VNHVLLVGRLEQNPEPRTNASPEDFVLLLAVKRRLPAGAVEPGVTSLEITVRWPRSRDCSELRAGDVLAVSGLIERNEWRDEGGAWHSRHEIVADWVEPLQPEPDRHE